MAYQYTNNATTTVGSTISPTDTQITLAVGGAALFPILSSTSDSFWIDVTKAADPIGDTLGREIMRVTATTGNVYTVVRAQQGTTAGSWSTGDIITLRVTALQYADFLSKTFGGIVQAPLTVNSSVTALQFNVFSDARMKSGITSVEDALSKLMAVRPVHYFMGPSQRHSSGFLAQEVQQVLPEAVSQDENGHLSVDYAQFIPILAAAMQELRAEMEQNRAKHRFHPENLIRSAKNALEKWKKPKGGV